MTVEDAVLSEKSRASVRLVTLVTVIIGAMTSTWYVANTKNTIDASLTAQGVRIDSIEKSMDRIASQIINRYTDDDAHKDWNTQQIINTKVFNSMEELRERMLELEKAISRMNVHNHDHNGGGLVPR